jgi:hypothetical protein
MEPDRLKPGSLLYGLLVFYDELSQLIEGNSLRSPPKKAQIRRRAVLLSHSLKIVVKIIIDYQCVAGVSLKILAVFLGLCCEIFLPSQSLKNYGSRDSGAFK